MNCHGFVERSHAAVVDLGERLPARGDECVVLGFQLAATLADANLEIESRHLHGFIEAGLIAEGRQPRLHGELLHDRQTELGSRVGQSREVDRRAPDLVELTNAVPVDHREQ